VHIDSATQQFIEAHRQEDVKMLALQAKRYPQVDMPFALNQIAGWQTASTKLPSWAALSGIVYPMHLSMEQCSSEPTARYKASLVKGRTLVDLTGGLGVDCSFLSRKFEQVDYVERQAGLAEIAEHNFEVLGLRSKVTVHTGDGVDFLQKMNKVDVIYLDPARRDNHGGKVVSIADCEPDVSRLEDLLLQKADTVLIKLSPMFDVKLACQTLRHVQAIHIIAVNNECKELLLLLSKTTHLDQEEIPFFCLNIGKSGETQCFSFTGAEESKAMVRYSDPESFLYEPNAAIMKAQGFKVLTERFLMKKLQNNSHLYTSSEWIPEFPGRKFQIQEVSGLGKKELKSFLDGLTQANLTVRNFPMTVADLRKRLKIKEGGEYFLFATTLQDNRKVLIKAIPFRK
jgi:hypothetical protein